MTPLARPFNISPEIWREVVDLLLSDDSEVPNKHRPEVTRGHFCVEVLGSVSHFFYWITRPHMWQSLYLSPLTLADVARRADHQEPGTTNRSLGSFVKSLSVNWDGEGERHPMEFGDLIEKTTNLSRLRFSSCVSRQHDATANSVPQSLIRALQTYQPPLRQVILRGRGTHPTIDQLNDIVRSCRKLEEVELLECVPCMESIIQPDLHSQNGPPLDITLPSLRLTPFPDATRLDELACQWDIGTITQLVINQNIDLLPWLRRFGAGLKTLTCPASSLGTPRVPSVFPEMCPQMESLTLQLGEATEGPSTIPESLQWLGIGLDHSYNLLSLEEQAHRTEEILSHLVIPVCSALRIISLDIEDYAFQGPWFGNFESDCRRRGIEIRTKAPL